MPSARFHEEVMEVSLISDEIAGHKRPAIRTVAAVYMSVHHAVRTEFS